MGTAAENDRQLRVRSWPEWMWPNDTIFRAGRGFWPRPGRLLSGDEWLPEMDIFERDEKVVVRVDAPGMKREDIEISVEDDTLLIRGHRNEDKEIRKEHYQHIERTAGSFSRAIRLPRSIDPAHIDATYANGVLEVVVPQPQAEQKKSVSVKVK